jgi:bacillolysin
MSDQRSQESRNLSSKPAFIEIACAIWICAGLIPGAAHAATTATIPTSLNIPGWPGLSGLNASLDLIQQALDTVRANASVRDLLKTHSEHTLTAAQHIVDPELQTTKFQHFYKNLEVMGSMAFHQVGRAGTQVVNRLADFDLDVRPTLSEAQAIRIALSTASRRSVQSKPALKILPDSEGNSARLIYTMDLDSLGHDGGRRVLIDAHSGEIIANISKELTIAPIQIYNAANQGVSITSQGGDDPSTATSCTITDLSTGALVKTLSATECQNLTPDMLPANTKCQLVFDNAPVQVDVTTCNLAIQDSQQNASSDDAAVRASQNSLAVLNYYSTHHGRNSYDGSGGTLVSVVHGGIQYMNAHWSLDEKIMVYGDGDGKTFGDFTRGVDVAGHEMTHGVTMETAKLDMMGQSGALNEANSDFFGIMIANGGTDWAIGRQLFLQQGPQNAIRDLAQPANLKFCAQITNGQCAQRLPYPSTLAQMQPISGTCDQTNDNCWVHINATIPGHAAYLVTQAIGAQKAEHLYYLTLTQSLSARDDIQTAAEAYKRTCIQVFDAPTCTQVTQAFAQVGL